MKLSQVLGLCLLIIGAGLVLRELDRREHAPAPADPVAPAGDSVLLDATLARQVTDIFAANPDHAGASKDAALYGALYASVARQLEVDNGQIVKSTDVLDFWFDKSTHFQLRGHLHNPLPTHYDELSTLLAGELNPVINGEAATDPKADVEARPVTPEMRGKIIAILERFSAACWRASDQLHSGWTL